MTVSRAGQQLLELIEQGINTEEALEKATGKDPEDIARALSALSSRKLILRSFYQGEMRYFLVGR